MKQFRSFLSSFAEGMGWLFIVILISAALDGEISVCRPQTDKCLINIQNDEAKQK